MYVGWQELLIPDVTLLLDTDDSNSVLYCFSWKSYIVCLISARQTMFDYIYFP